MPFIISRVNCPIRPEQEQELKAWLGQAISLVPGKSEDYLLLGFEDNCRLWLRGQNDQPVAYVEANIFGNEGHRGYEAFTAEVTRMFHHVLNIPPENVYISFTDIPAWSVQGMYIDRNRYR